MLAYRSIRFTLIVILASIVACATTVQETLLRCDECEQVRVSRVIDGDTFETASGRLRLFGADTPEVGEQCAAEATGRMNELAGNSVRLEDGPRLADQFGRRLAYVYTEDGYSIDEILVREGLGTAWTEDGQHRDFLVGLEKGTRMMDDGCLWSK
jgi:micrococcal nuclease|tara:strand:- start:280 stop:744 length:465 start_codon:yes stop_codon:yes gene_type:complete